MRKKLAMIMAALACLLLAACNVTVSVNGMSPEEYYLSTEYPDYTIVKTAAVADIEAFLLKGAEDYVLVYSKDGKHFVACDGLTTAVVCNPVWDEYGHQVIVAGANPDFVHSSYTLPYRDKPEIGDNLVDSLTPNKDDWNQTLITRDVSRQEYILDIYLLPIYYNLDLQNTRWDDGSLL